MNSYGFYQKSVTISLAPEVYECLTERADDLLVTPAQYIATALVNQLQYDYQKMGQDDFTKKIGTKNLLKYGGL